MKLKLDDKGNVVVQDGKPVYEVDGKDVAFDAAGTVATIGRLNAEAKSHREAKEAEREAKDGALAKLKLFEGIEDPKKALEALKITANLDHKKLVDAGEVEKVKAEAIKAVEDKYAPIVKKAETLEAALYAEKIGGNFARSKMIAEKLVIPADMVQARFGSAFKIEDGKVVAYDPTGNKLFSKGRPGELADFDEALDMLVEQYPYKDHIIKSPGSSGGGASGSGGAAPGAKQVKRAAWDAMPQDQRAAHVKGGGTVID